MPLWITLLVVALVLAAGAWWLARARQARINAALLAGLEGRARVPGQPGLPTPDLSGLPPPVRRYLEKALPPGVRRMALARYAQAGALRTRPDSQQWMRFTATHTIAPANAEFLWSAQVAAFPLLSLGITDSLLEGTGAGQVALGSALTVASAAGVPELTSGALHRFLAEAPWYPAALLPSAALTWAPIDASRALATLSVGTTTVSLEFRFSADDDIVGIYTPGRWGRFDGKYKRVAWEGRFSGHRGHQGVRVPTQGEVGWYLGGVWQPVWRGSVVKADFEF